MSFLRATVFSYFLSGVFFCYAVSAVEATVKTDFMEVYTGAGRGYPVYFVVEKNEKFDLLKRRTDWIEIKSQQGQIGWVSFKDYALAVHRGRYLPKNTAIKSKWELGVSAGVFGADQTFSAGVGYYLNPMLAIQAEAKKVIGDFSHSNIISAHFMIQGFRSWVLNPFLNAGVGRMINVPRESLVNAANGHGNVYSIGTGINSTFYKRMNVRFSVNNYYLDKLGESYIDVRLGVFALFG